MDETTQFELLVPETRITISTMEEAMLFIVQSIDEKLRPDLDRNLTEVKAEARCMVLVVSENYNIKERELVYKEKNLTAFMIGSKDNGGDGCPGYSASISSPWGRKRIEKIVNRTGKCQKDNRGCPTSGIGNQRTS